MQLKISSPAKTIFEWEIKEIILPTEIGEVKILPWHTPMVTVLKPWIINLIPTEKYLVTILLFEEIIQYHWVFEKAWLLWMAK